MTSTPTHTADSAISLVAPGVNPRLYWAATGLLCLIFTVSAALTFLDPETTRVQTVELGFPGYTIYPLAVAKLVAVAVILWGRSRTLTGFAFAGFLFDLVLALSAHISKRETYGWLAVFALVVWSAAYYLDRQRFGHVPLRPR